MSAGLILLAVAGILILFGAAQRVLDRLRLTDRQALVFTAAMFVGGLIPDVRIAQAFSFNIGGALIPLLTLGIPGDGCVAIMLSALMINGLNPGLSLFTEQGDIMYAIMLGLILVNAFMFVQGRFLTNLFAKVVSVPQEILTPIIVMFCFAGAFSVNKSYFDVLVALVFCAVAWLLRKIDFPAVPILLGLVLGKMAETNFRRALMVSRGSYSIFVSSPFCIAFLALTALVIGSAAFNKMKARKKKNG